MARKKTSGSAVERSGSAIARIDETTAPHRFGREIVPDVASFRSDIMRFEVEGPWSGEADKYAWWDRDTSLACIIRREERGNLGGYVAVSPGHPLYGMCFSVVPHGLDIEVHGGLSYAKPCDAGQPEARSICHVPDQPLDAVAGSRVGVADRDLWWFGFACDQGYDYVPLRPWLNRSEAVTGRVYRDEAYVYRQVVQLAAQLDAIARGLPKPPLADPPPPLSTPTIRLKDGR